MKPGNLKVVKDAPVSQSRTAAAIVGLVVNSDEQNIPALIPVRKGLHLDVDEILRHSLPTVSQFTVLRRVNQGAAPSEAPR